MADRELMEFNLSEEEWVEYVDLHLHLAGGGFSKGTANVSARDYKKLLPLLKHYAKKAHPFRACVKDNRKRFGPLTEKYCAVVKDLIYGSTQWRNKKKEKGMKKVVLSELDWTEETYLDLAEFVEWVTPEMITEIILADEEAEGGVNLGMPNTQIGKLKDAEKALLEFIENEHDAGDIIDIKSCIETIGRMRAKDRADRAIAKSNINSEQPVMAHYSDDADPVDVAEMFFADGGQVEEDGLLWKTLMREGTWSLSPGPGQRAVKKPINVVRSGKSDPATMTVSLDELDQNFKDGAIEHVTVPVSHENKVTDNTGFLRATRLAKDENGKWVLEGGLDFTEPEIKEQALRGTIANTSAGILFDYPRKEDGKQFGAVLEHVALTNKPWLSGMKPFGFADESARVVSFSEGEPEEMEDTDDLLLDEQEVTTEEMEGGNKVENEETKVPTLEEKLGLSEEEIKSIVEENKSLKLAQRETDAKAQIAAWQEAKYAPAVLAVAEEILLADAKSANGVNLSEDGTGLTLSEVVTKLVEASPVMNLDETKVSEEDATEGNEPPEGETDEVVLSDDVQAEANRIWLYDRKADGMEYSEEEALEAAKAAAATK